MVAVVFDTNALVGFLHVKCIRIVFAPVNVVKQINKLISSCDFFISIEFLTLAKHKAGDF